MRRKWLLAAAVLLITASGSVMAAGRNGEYRGFPVVNVVVNGKTVQGEVPGINMDGTTLVPLRLVSESLGAKVGWEQETSTATVALALPATEVKAEQKLLMNLIALSKDLAELADRAAITREQIRIAKEFYEIRGNDHRLLTMNEAYWKAYTDRYNEIVMGLSELKDTKNEYSAERLELLKAAEQVQKTFASYKLSVDQLKLNISTGQKQFLEHYIVSYSQAFDQEQEALGMIQNLQDKLTKLL